MVDDCIVVVIPRARCVTPVQEMPHNSGGQLASAFGLEASLQIRQGLMQISLVRAPGNLSSAVERADKPRRSIKKLHQMTGGKGTARQGENPKDSRFGPRGQTATVQIKI
jgi:hypothetical protein